MIPFWLAVFKRPAGRLLWPGLAAYYGPDWPGIMALLAGENGYMHFFAFLIYSENAPSIKSGALYQNTVP